MAISHANARRLTIWLGALAAFAGAIVALMQLGDRVVPARRPDVPSGWEVARGKDIKWLAGEWCENRYVDDGWRQTISVKGSTITTKMTAAATGYDSGAVTYEAFKTGDFIALGSPNPTFILRKDAGSFEEFKTGSADPAAQRQFSYARYKCDRCGPAEGETKFACH